MRRAFYALALLPLLLIPSATARDTAAPIYGLPPTIQQQGARLCVIDNASWFTQGADRATRYVHVWYWNGGNIWGIPEPPWRSDPARQQLGEGLACIPLGPANIGGSFYVKEYGGVESVESDDGAWVEWGREQSANRDDQSKWGARSNTIVVKDWRPPAQPPPPPGDALAAMGFAKLREALDSWRSQGIPAEKTDAWLVGEYRSLNRENKARARAYILELVAGEE